MNMNIVSHHPNILETNVIDSFGKFGGA